MRFGARRDAGAAPVHGAAVAALRRVAEVGAGLGPAGLLAARVVVRAAEPVVGDRRAERRAPVAVGDDRLGRAVGVGDLEAADQPRRDLRAGARVERGERVARAGDRRAGGVRGVERRRERDAGARRGDRGARGVGLRRARARTSRPCPAGRSRTGAPCACTIVSGGLSVMPVPLAPAVPTAEIVRVSRLAPVSTVIVSPTAKPVTLATLRADGFGVAGVWMFWFHGAMPYWPAENAAGHAESSNAAVFQPAGGVAGVPASAFHVVSVTIRWPSSSSAPIRLPPLPALVAATAITLVPGHEPRLDVDDLRGLPGVVAAARLRDLLAVDVGDVRVVGVDAQLRARDARRVGDRERLAHVDRARGRAGRGARDVPDPARALQRRRRRRRLADDRGRRQRRVDRRGADLR